MKEKRMSQKNVCGILFSLKHTKGLVIVKKRLLWYNKYTMRGLRVMKAE